MKKYGKIDANQTGIVRDLRKAGCRVLSLASVGGGCPDLLVYRPTTGLFTLLEIKDGSKPPSARKLTPDQVKFHKIMPTVVVCSTEEAYTAVGING